MKKSELKQLIREVVKEDHFSRQHPDGNKKFGETVPGVWSNYHEVEELKARLVKVLDAGNFDLAHQIVDELVQLHN
jgi:hypothetical protein